MICYMRKYLKEKRLRIRCDNELKKVKHELQERIRELEEVIQENKVMWERRSERAKLLSHLEALRQTSDSIPIDCGKPRQ